MGQVVLERLLPIKLLVMLYIPRARLSPVLHPLALHQSSCPEVILHTPASTYHCMWMELHIALYLKMALKLTFSSRLLYLFGMKSSCNRGIAYKQWTALYRKSLTLPFSSIVVLWGGDFRQILPVVERGSREDIIYASIQHSYLWQHVCIFHLTQNMQPGQSPEK
jgi:hypothetical protein